ncbi:ATP-binding protein [Rubrimonas cliftonensis]|uniref:histidine kinase n=1 Tax=Rubrimonas cliftonensis TaxID=89524 RepID=A0A1H3VE32_9RHOB|nr:ATP-binding protein [Rubrimonas cliftonensis]SDZ72990.1 two-component system, OmpR family, osmolarity sensor histidine kinase EnvZ [Rubrimonas cliftonensis]
MKRYLPRGLFGRALLILLVPVILVQAVGAAAIVQRYYDGVTRQLATAVAADINYVVARVERAEGEAAAAEAAEEAAEALGLSITLDPGEIVAVDALRQFYDVTGGVLEEALKAGVRRPITVDLLSLDKHAIVAAQTDKGVIRAEIDRGRLNPSNPHQIFVWMAASSVVLVTVAALFLRNQVRPIKALAAAAEAFGKGRAAAFHPAGAEEVRRAGAAFLDMRGRIERQIESRTLMLSGVSHDLRTPLTRMKLALELMDDESERADLAQDVAQMERMIDAFLDFVRGEAGEATVRTDPVALAEEVAAAARRGGGEVALRAEIDTPERTTAELRPETLRRALANLVQNAVDYGGRAEITVRMTRRWLDIDVEDAGPGIPAAQRELAMRPFTRLDAARNQNVCAAAGGAGGGVGLGLSIASEAARSHGGGLILDVSPRLGGLRARLRLPR